MSTSCMVHSRNDKAIGTHIGLTDHAFEGGYMKAEPKAITSGLKKLFQISSYILVQSFQNRSFKKYGVYS